MHPPISPEDLATLIDEADTSARRLQRKLALPAADLDDLRQSLLLDLICRLPSYDSGRGTIGAFANVVLRNQSSRIAAQIYRERHNQGGSVLSLDAPLAGGSDSLGELLSEANGLSAWHGQHRSAARACELRHDLAGALADLPDELRRLCAALGSRTITDQIAHSGISRSSFYRRVSRLRLELAMRGVGGRWDTLEAW